MRKYHKLYNVTLLWVKFGENEQRYDLKVAENDWVISWRRNCLTRSKGICGKFQIKKWVFRGVIFK